MGFTWVMEYIHGGDIESGLFVNFSCIVKNWLIYTFLRVYYSYDDK